jgi:glycosyltransferase involved in cell wall biosynthesis
MAGVKTHVMDILRNIDLRGLQIEYFYSVRRSDSAFPGELEAVKARGIRCHEVPMRVELRPAEDLRAFVQLWFLLRKFRPHVLHLHSSKASGLGRILSLLLWPKPAVIYTPNAMACYRSSVYLVLERMLGYLTDVLVAVSASEKRDFIQWKIPGAVDATQLTVGVRHVEVPVTVPDPTTWTIGACGRICYQKNALLFFRTALAMIAGDATLRFRWIGEFADDEEAIAVRALLEAAGNPSQITITGWVVDPHREMAALDTFCMFSRYESFGYVTADAMLLGVPVVALPSTGTMDLVQHGVTGLITNSDESQVTADLLKIKSDAGLRNELIINARDFIQQVHTVEKMVAQMAQIYLEASHARAPQRDHIVASAPAVNGPKLEDSYRGRD